MPAGETKPETPPAETPKMEVHHHPDLSHGPKSWKRYLLEGLMIFVAVTLGFFAEQLREHFVEKYIANAKLRSNNSMVFLNWLLSLSTELIVD
jgi:hypothetical protein